MDTVKYVKSFSKGQITIPKQFRDRLGLPDEAWIKLSLEGRKIVAEPVEAKKINREEWREKILAIKGTWDLSDDIKKARAEVEENLMKNAL